MKSKLKGWIFGIIILIGMFISIFPIKVKAWDYGTFHLDRGYSSINGKKFGVLNDYNIIEPGQSGTIDIRLAFNILRSTVNRTGYFPVIDDIYYFNINMCANYNNVITDLYPMTDNRLGYAFDTGEKCNFDGWEGTVYNIYGTMRMRTFDSFDNEPFSYQLYWNNLAFGYKNTATYGVSIRWLDAHIIDKVDYENVLIQAGIIKKTEQQVVDTRNIWQKMADLPSDLWNFMKNIPSQVWGFFSAAFDTVVNAISSIGTFILDLPGNIWNGLKTGFEWVISALSDLGGFILNGLKDLFIPSGLAVDNLVDSFKNKLGFIYEVPYSVISYGLNLSNIHITEMDSIHLPTITIFGHNFWGSQDINITESINTFKPYRYLTSIGCVVFCINALFKYKDKIFGGGGDYK